MSVIQERMPLLGRNALSATSTHDCKRGEDVRARLNTLSEIPGALVPCCPPLEASLCAKTSIKSMASRATQMRSKSALSDSRGLSGHSVLLTCRLSPYSWR
jgi:maltooligosyltrehalose synthase